MTEELKKQLMAAGLTKQQAASVTAETLVNLFMQEDGKTLIAEAKRQVNEMKNLISLLKIEYLSLQKKIQDISDTLLAISDAQKIHGEVTDAKAKNLIALYGALLTMNERCGSSGSDAVTNASYVTYAYLGGQAKRENTYYYEKPRE